MSEPTQKGAGCCEETTSDPPLAVLWKRGLGSSFVLSIILTLLGYVPGVVYAIYVVVTGRD